MSRPGETKTINHSPKNLRYVNIDAKKSGKEFGRRPSLFRHEKIHSDNRLVCLPEMGQGLFAKGPPGIRRRMKDRRKGRNRYPNQPVWMAVSIRHTLGHILVGFYSTFS